MKFIILDEAKQYDGCIFLDGIKLLVFVAD